jgi:nucleoid-associated protein YgaU
MKLSTWIQKFQISLTAITLMGFAVLCVILGSYAFLLRKKELTTQDILRRELRDLREENTHLTEQNHELEQQIISIQAAYEESQKTGSDEKDVQVELEKGSQRSFVYTVKKGDTLWDIAAKYNVEVSALMRRNNLTPRSRIFPGDRLTIILKE